MALQSLTNLSLSVKARNAAFFEESHIFFSLNIQKLHLDGYRYLFLGCDAQICSQSVRSKRSRIFSAAFRSMAELRELYFRQDYVPETISVLVSSPLTKLVLERCRINQDAADALAQVIQESVTLKTIKIEICAKESADISPILLAISESTSIRYFYFECDALNLDCREFDSFIHMIQSSRTLRTLKLHDVVGSISQMCRALEALRSNTSIWRFDSFECKQVPPWPEPCEAEEAKLNTLLLELMSYNSTLIDIGLTFGINKSYPILRKQALREAFFKNISLSSLSLVMDQRENDAHVLASKSIPEALLLNDQAVSVFKIGRVLSGESLVCGQRLPIELIEEIMRQVTVESVWDDGLWKPIRRIAVDRRTIGRLLTNDEPFDAYELLYRCRSLN